MIYISKVSWCSWLSRQSNTLKVSGSSPGDARDCGFKFFSFLVVCTLIPTHTSQAQIQFTNKKPEMGYD